MLLILYLSICTGKQIIDKIFIETRRLALKRLRLLKPLLKIN